MGGVIENDWREKRRNLGDQERARIGRQENKNEAKTIGGWTNVR